MSDADDLWTALANDPVGTYEAIGSHLAEAGVLPEDPRLTEMYADFQAGQEARELAVYDAAVQEVIEANPDIEASLLHPFVAAADGDFAQAVDMYRATVGDVLGRFGVAPPVTGGADAPVDFSDGLTPQQRLHAAVEAATAASSRRPR